MSAIYLVLVLGFLILFFRQDQKEWPGFSLSLWIPLIWLVTSTTRLISILRPSGAIASVSIEASIEGDPITRLIAIALILAGILVLILRRDRIAAFLRANKGILIFYAYVLLSIAWSDSPGISFRRYIRLCGALIMAFIVVSEKDQHGGFEHVFRRYAAICLALSFFYIRTDRSIGYVIGVHGDHFMAGILGHKNDLGTLCMFSFIFFLWRAMRAWPAVSYFDGLLILINIYLLVRAQCTTALVLAIFGTALMIGLKIVKGGFRKSVVSIMILVIITLPIFLLAMNSASAMIPGSFFEITGRDATLSGRIPMWRDLINLGRDDLILGSGYEAYWIRHYREIWAMWSFLPINAHNGFVEVLLNLGVLGLAIMISVITRALGLAGSEDQLSRPYGRWYLIVLIMLVINNITEASLAKLTLGWSLFLFISANSEKDRGQHLTNPRQPSP